MPQVLKEPNREQIIQSATEAFATDGYRGSTMAGIARRAELSTGNLYRYFRHKEELFHAVLDEAFVARFSTLLERRVTALAALNDFRRLDARAKVAQRELLEFWVSHRLQVVILLDRCAGTQYADFGAYFVTRLVELTSSELQRSCRAPLPELASFTLYNIFDGTRRTIVSILERHSSADDIADAFAAFWSFQLAGLHGLKHWVTS